MNRRGLLLGGALAFGGGLASAGLLPARAQDGPPIRNPEIALALNSAEATISILDQSNLSEIRRIPALREPHHLVLAPDGSEVVVGDSGGNELLFLDPVSGVMRRRLAVSNPYHLGFSPDGQRLVVVSLRRDQVDVYDSATMTLVKRFGVRRKPSHLAFSPDSRRVFVTIQSSGDVVAFDLERLEMLWRREVGSEPAGIAFTPGGVLAVGVMGRDYIAALSPDDGATVHQATTGKGAHAIFVSPDRSLLYVTNRVAGTISELDSRTLAPRRTLELHGGPDCLAFSRDGTRMWVTRRWAQQVAVLDLASGNTLESIPVGRSPHGIHVRTA